MRCSIAVLWGGGQGDFLQKIYEFVRDIIASALGPLLPVIMNLKAFFDESKQADGLWCVAGCISSLEQWELFESAWKLVLGHDDYKIDWHHQVDWTHTTGEQFKKWADDKKTKEDYQGNLLRIMDHHVMRYVGAVIPGSAYRTLNEEQQRIIQSPYLPCLQYCLHAAALEAMDLPEEVKVDVVIAERPGWKDRAKEIYKLAREYLPLEARKRLSQTVAIRKMPKGLNNIGPDEEKPEIPLEAADIVAYELGQYTQGKCRFPMTQLMKTKEHYFWKIFDTDSLNAACQPWTPS